MLTRDAVLAAAPAAVGRLAVPEWGGEVGIRPLTLDDLFEWQQARSGELAGAKQAAAALLVRLSLVDDAGAPLFGEDDMPFLEGLPGMFLQRLASGVLEHNQLAERQQAAAAGN